MRFRTLQRPGRGSLGLSRLYAACRAMERRRGGAALSARAMLALLCLTGAIWNGRAEGEGSSQGGIKDLDAKAFQAVLGGEGIWVIAYKDPSCQPCQALAPVIEELAGDLEPLGIPVGLVDTSDKKLAKLAMGTGIKGLPALQLFAGEAKPNPYTGKMHREAQSYVFQSPSPKARQLKKFVTEALPNTVTAVSDEGFSDLVKASFSRGLAVVLTFSSRGATSPLLKALALRFKDRLVLAEVSMSQEGLVSAFDVEEAPAILVLPPPEDKDADATPTVLARTAVRYTGNAKDMAELSAFLGTHAAAEPVPVVSDKANAAKEEEAAAEEKGKKKDKSGIRFDPQKPPVSYELEDGEWDTVVMKDETAAWVVWFKETEDTTDSEWDTVIPKAEGAVHPGHINCADEAFKSLCAKFIKDPSKRFVSLPFGEKEDEHKAFASALEAFEDASDTVPMEQVKRGDMTPTALDTEVSEALAKSKYPVVVLARKPEPPLFVRSLALQMADVASFIYVTNPPKELLARFQDPHVPTLIVLMTVDKKLSDGPQLPSGTPHNFRLAVYNNLQFGPLKYRGVLSFMLNVMQQQDPTYGQRLFGRLVRGIEANGASNPQAAASTNKAAGKVTAVTRGEWGGPTQCSPSSSLLCVVAFTAGEVSPAQTKVLRTVAQAEASSPLSFFTVDGLCHAQFAEAFDLQPSKLPTLVVYSAKKQRYASYIGTFGAEDIRSFLRGVLSGRIPTAPVVTSPAVDEQCADLSADSTGMNGSDLGDVVEEEEDLGDLMAEILQDEKRKKEELAATLKREQEERKRAAEEAAQKEAEAAAEKAKKKKKKNRKKAKKAAGDTDL